MLQAGDYYAHLKSGALGTSEKNNTPQVELVFSVTAIAMNGGWQEMPPVDRTVYLFLTDNAWEWTEKKLKSLGFNGDFNAPAFSPDASSVGLSLTCKHEDYQGKTKEKWDLASWGEREVKPPAQDVVARLSAKWRSSAGSPPPAGRPTPPPRQSVPATPRQPNTIKAEPQPGTRDHAWSEFLKANENKPDMAEFNKSIDAVTSATGRTVEQFTADDWKGIAESVAIPF